MTPSRQNIIGIRATRVTRSGHTEMDSFFPPNFEIIIDRRGERSGWV
jgi:hypothetical protein